MPRAAFLACNPVPSWDAPYPNGSRFRRAGMTQGVFYGAQREETAAAEIAYYRLLDSPETAWPANPGQYTAFCAEYGASRSIDLTMPPLNEHRDLWMDPTDRGACQALADQARELDIEVIKYFSVRDPGHGLNIAILSCRAFTKREPVMERTWRIHLSVERRAGHSRISPSCLGLRSRSFRVRQTHCRFELGSVRQGLISFPPASESFGNFSQDPFSAEGPGSRMAAALLDLPNRNSLLHQLRPSRHTSQLPQAGGVASPK